MHMAMHSWMDRGWLSLVYILALLIAMESVKLVLPKKALVRWRGQTVPIANRYGDVHNGFTYLINVSVPGRGLVQDKHVTIGQLMAELCEHAAFCVGDALELPQGTWFVLARWWHLRKGCIFYRICADRDGKGRNWRVAQEDLVKRTQVAV